MTPEKKRPGRKIDSVLPETQEEAESLAASIERAVQRQTGASVRNLTVEVRGDGVLIRGRCDTYYCKQLAQTAAMAFRSARPLTNAIEVDGEREGSESQGKVETSVARRIRESDPEPLISVYLDDCGLSEKEKLLFLEYLADLYRDLGGAGLKLVEGRTLVPEREAVPS